MKKKTILKPTEYDNRIKIKETFFMIYCTFAAIKDNDNVKSKILSLLLNNETHKNKEIVI